MEESREFSFATMIGQCYATSLPGVLQARHFESFWSLRSFPSLSQRADQSPSVFDTIRRPSCIQQPGLLPRNQHQ